VQFSRGELCAEASNMSPRSFTALVCLVLLVVLLAWPDGPAPTLNPGPEQGVTNPRPQSLSATADDRSHGPVHEEARVESATQSQGLRLRVIDSETRRGIAGVTVWFVAADFHRKLPGRYRDRLEFARGVWDRGTRFRGNGIAVETDAGGFAEVPLSQGAKLHAFAEHGTAFGLTEIDLHEATDPTLVVGPGSRIRFLVQDSAGVPIAGAKLQWGFSHRGAKGDAMRWNDQRTDADGFEMHHVNLPSEEVREGKWLLHARARIAGTSFVTVPATIVRLGLQVVRMTLGSVCRMSLRFVDTTGAPVRQEADVLLRASDQPDRRQQSWSPLRSGTAEFPLARGRSYIVRLGSYFPRECEWTIDVPPSAGPTENRTLALPAGISVLSLRAVSRSGKPVANARLNVTLQRNKQFLAIAVDTDNDGRGQLLIPTGWSNVALDQAVLKQWIDRGERADLAASSPFPSGCHDLGTIVLARNRPIATGVVQLENGAATKAIIHVQRLRPNGRWVTEPVFTEWNGNRFESYGVASSARFRVRAIPKRGSSGRPSAWHEAGDQPLSLVLPEGQTLTVELTGLNAKGLTATVRAIPLSGPAAEADEVERSRWHGYWRSEFERDPSIVGLPEGRYRVEIRFSTTPGVLDAFETEITKTGPAPTASIDLSQHLRRVCLRLTRNGKPLTRGFVTAVGSSGVGSHRMIHDGLATLWLAHPATVAVHEPDKPVVELPSVFADATIDVGR